MLKKNDSPLVDLASVAVLLFLLFYILVVGATLIIPFVIALLFSFAII
jgi:hypothetical protein